MLEFWGEDPGGKRKVLTIEIEWKLEIMEIGPRKRWESAIIVAEFTIIIENTKLGDE